MGQNKKTLMIHMRTKLETEGENENWIKQFADRKKYHRNIDVTYKINQQEQHSRAKHLWAQPSYYSVKWIGLTELHSKRLTLNIRSNNFRTYLIERIERLWLWWYFFFSIDFFSSFSSLLSLLYFVELISEKRNRLNVTLPVQTRKRFLLFWEDPVGHSTLP